MVMSEKAHFLLHTRLQSVIFFTCGCFSAMAADLAALAFFARGFDPVEGRLPMVRRRWTKHGQNTLRTLAKKMGFGYLDFQNKAG